MNALKFKNIIIIIYDYYFTLGILQAGYLRGQFVCAALDSKVEELCIHIDHKGTSHLTTPMKL